MAVELEKREIPVALVTSLTQIALAVGANRIVAGSGIPHPVGDPSLPLEAEKRHRRQLLMLALKSLTTEVEGPRVFHLEQ